MQKNLKNDTSKDKIRLLIMLNTLGIGGAEVQLARTVPHLDNEKFDVHIAYYSKLYQGYPEKMLTDAGIKVTFFDRDKWGRIPYFFKVAKFMRKHRFDIVHAWSGTANLYARVPAILANVPCIIGGILGERSLNGAFGILFSLTNFRCAGWTVNSVLLKELLQRKVKFLKHSPIYFVRNGIEIDNPNIFCREQQTCYDKLKSNKPVVGTLGRLDPVKNHKLFVEMAKNLKNMGIEADYWIIGEGPMKADIEKAIKNCGMENSIKLLGHRKHVNHALARMDVFVLTSDTEGCPNSLLEALRASLPAVSTNCASLEDIIEEGINGYICPKNDPLCLAQKVKNIITNDKRKSMGTRSRTIIEQRFAMPIVAERWQNVYMDCLKRSGRKHPKVLDKLKRLGYTGE